MQVLAEAGVVIHHQDARLALSCQCGLLGRGGWAAARGAKHLRVLVGKVDRLQAALHVQLPVQARQVVFDGLHAQAGHLGQRLVVQTLPQVTQQLLLAGGEGRADHRTLVGNQFFNQGPRDPALAGQHAGHRQLQIAERLVLEMVAVDPRAQQPLHVHIVIIGADHQDFHLREFFAHAGDGGNRVEVGHGHVDEQAVGAVSLQLVEQCRAVTDLCHDGDTFQLVHHVADARPNHGMIIGQQNTCVHCVKLYPNQAKLRRDKPLVIFVTIVE